MPKSKRRKPGRPGLDHSAAAKLRFFSLAKVLTECQTEPLEPEEHQGFVMPAYECLEKLRTGDAEAFEYQQLYYMLLTGLEIVSLVHTNAAETSAAPGGTITITQIQDGGSYVLSLTNTTGGNYTFTSSGVGIASTRCSPNTGTANQIATTAGKITLVNFIRIGNKVYCTFVSDF
jgi:hypothetical protein